MPAKSQAQQKFFGRLKANPAEAKAKGISPKVAKEFASLKGKKLSSLPKKKKIMKALSNLQKIFMAQTNTKVTPSKDSKPTKIKFKKPIMKKLLEIAQRRQDQMIAHLGHLESG